MLQWGRRGNFIYVQLINTTMKKTIIITLVFALVILVSCGTTPLAFPYADNECFERMMGILETEYNLDVSAHQFTKVRCESGLPYFQFEVDGYTKDGKIHAHYAVSGMAASGADSVEDMCLIVNHEIVISKRLTGRENKETDGSCAWDDNIVIEKRLEYIFP